MEKNILTLDFWQDTVIYEGKTYDSGTLGCDSLNISQTVIDRLNGLCMVLNLFMSTTNAGSGDPALLPTARESALQIVELLKAVPPFSYLDAAEAAKSEGRIFSEEYQKTMLPFAERLNEQGCKRTPEGYAELFGAAFPVTPNLGEGDSWMSMTNATFLNKKKCFHLSHH